MRRPPRGLLGTVGVLLALAACTSPALASDPQYPYRSPAFDAFVAESFRIHGGSAADFYRHMDRELATANLAPSWDRWIAAEKAKLGQGGRTEAEVRLGAEVHRAIKRTIRKFSLDRGFEFAYVVRTGERQCFLQSVLIVALAQSVGVRGGVAMVYKNPEGKFSNNGHAVSVLRLSDGTDRIVDASAATPYIRQQGLYLRTRNGTYTYADPIYREDAIVAYRLPNGKTVQPRDTFMLDVSFLNSMFDYYRGERAVGGILQTEKTAAGMAQSQKWLERSVQRNPSNPLAVYMLGRLYARTGQARKAEQTLLRAQNLYRSAGWTPGGLAEELARLRSGARPS